jgi:hypothetical protein
MNIFVISRGSFGAVVGIDQETRVGTRRLIAAVYLDEDMRTIEVHQLFDPRTGTNFNDLIATAVCEPLLDAIADAIQE